MYVGSDVNVMGGQSLHLELELLQNEVLQVNRKTNIKQFSSLAQIGLTDNASLRDIARRLPANSYFRIDTFADTHGATMPLPTMNEGRNYNSGSLIAHKAEDHHKVYFEWRNEYFICTCNYNVHVEDKVNDWFWHQIPMMNVNGATANYFQGRLDKIYIPGTYYFTAAQMQAFADRPTDAGSFVKVTNAGNKITSDRLYEVIENNGACRRFVKQNSNAWRYIPVMFPQAVGDAEMRIGDMKVAGDGNLHIRINSTTVKSLA